MDRRALAVKHLGTGQQSNVGLTPFSSHIAHVDKSKAAVKPGQVSGLQEEIGAHRGKKLCEVKSSLFVKPNITLNVSMDFTGSRQPVLDPVQEERVGEKKKYYGKKKKYQ